MVNDNVAIDKTNPFNPGSPVDPNDFVGRMIEIENFKQRLKQTEIGSLASMAVAGGYGIGKTSFLHKCKTIADENEALSIYFSLNELAKLDRQTLAGILIERLTEKVNEEAILNKISHGVLNALKKIKITIKPIDISFRDGEGKEFPNLHSALESAWKIIKNDKKAIVFFIDEARVLEKNRAELILYLRAVLEQLQIKRIPVMIIPGGKLTISGPSGSGFSPLVRTFPPVILENFTEEESNTFIRKKLSKTGMRISDELLKLVYNVTEGHPFVLNAYMFTAYSKLNAGENEFKIEHFKATDVEFVKRVLSQFFARFYDQAGKNSKLILNQIVKNGGEITLSELSNILEKDINEISPYLAKLTQDGAIIRIERGKYKLFHKLLSNYIKED